MTKFVNGVMIIETEPDAVCEECGKVDELRPYGKDGARICYECGMKDPATLERMKAVLEASLEKSLQKHLH